MSILKPDKVFNKSKSESKSKPELGSKLESKSNSELDSESESEFEQAIFVALGHEYRRKILKLIGKNGSTGFSDIKRLLKVSTGTVYHHLDVLKDLVQQNEQKKYYFTRIGEHAYNMLQTGSDFQELSDNSQRSLWDRPLKNWQAWLLGQPIFKFYFSNYNASIGFSVLNLTLIAGLSMLIRVQAFVNIFLPIFEPLESILIRYPIIQFISVFLGYALLVGLVEILARGLFKKKENWRWLLSVLSISYIPLVFYLLCIGILRLFSMHSSTFLIITRILLVIFQAWGTIILAIGISLVKVIKFERSLMIVLFIDYATFMVLLLFNTPLL